ncbi:MAG: cell division protein ZapA [Prevotella sp.]|jgi:cell division protein ZapA|nr:cell division protein ZapA [Prevotella sp.]
MAGKDTIRIKLNVYDRELGVTVPREEEGFYRQAAKLITDKVNTYASFYKGRSADKDILYMAMIDIALLYVKNKERNDTEPYNKLIEKLTSEIEEALG